MTGTAVTTGVPAALAPDTSDEARFRDLFAATYEAVLRFIERRHDPPGAEDVAAEVFLVAWRRLDDVPVPIEEARAWLLGVARRTLANQRRGEARRRGLQLRLGQHAAREAGPDEGQDVLERFDLARAWALLSPTDQEVLTLVGVEDLTSTQAARVLGISATALRVRLVRARRRLRTHLARHGAERPVHDPHLTPTDHGGTP